MARNIDRKQLKNPDQFVSFWSRVASRLADQRRVVLVAVVAVLAAAAGGWALYGFQSTRAVRATAEFARIEKIATAELQPAAGAAPKDDGLPHFKTEKERLEAALKEADAFLSNHGSSKLRHEVLLLKARFLVALGKADDAGNIYRELLGGGLAPRLKFLARDGLGYALEAAGQTDQAIAAFRQLADDAANQAFFYRDRALFAQARLLQKKGDTKEAEKLYREVLDKMPTSTLRDEINDRLAALENK